jgi:hypothetical protein
VPRVPLYDADGKPVQSEKTGKPLRIAASAWLDRYRPVEQMTWAPGEEMLNRDRLNRRRRLVPAPQGDLLQPRPAAADRSRRAG